MSLDAAGEFYYNTETGQVEEGKQSDYTERMGPYPTREAAAHAWEIARQRNREAAAYDRQGEDAFDRAEREWREGAD